MSRGPPRCTNSRRARRVIRRSRTGSARSRRLPSRSSPASGRRARRPPARWAPSGARARSSPSTAASVLRALRRRSCAPWSPAPRSQSPRPTPRGNQAPPTEAPAATRVGLAERDAGGDVVGGGGRGRGGVAGLAGGGARSTRAISRRLAHELRVHVALPAGDHDGGHPRELGAGGAAVERALRDDDAVGIDQLDVQLVGAPFELRHVPTGRRRARGREHGGERQLDLRARRAAVVHDLHRRRRDREEENDADRDHGRSIYRGSIVTRAAESVTRAAESGSRNSERSRKPVAQRGERVCRAAGSDGRQRGAGRVAVLG